MKTSTTTRSNWRPLALLAGLLLASGCQSQAVTPEATTPAMQGQADVQAEKAVLDRIHADIGPAACDTDAQCHTLAVGEKSCGGPLAWLPWSTRSSEEKTLRQHASQLAALQRQRYARSGEMSTCSYHPDPGAQCLAQRCVLRAANLAS